MSKGSCQTSEPAEQGCHVAFLTEKVSAALSDRCIYCKQNQRLLLILVLSKRILVQSSFMFASISLSLGEEAWLDMFSQRNIPMGVSPEALELRHAMLVGKEPPLRQA